MVAMVNKCCVYGCKSGYSSSKLEKVSLFQFPLKRPDLCCKWMAFVNRKNFRPTKYTRICEKHFEKKYISAGLRKDLIWDMEPVPTIYTAAQMNKSPAQSPAVVSRKPPKARSILPDQLQGFRQSDRISSFDELDERHAPPGYLYHKFENEYVSYYKMCFGSSPRVSRMIRIGKELKVRLERDGVHVPLPGWFSSKPQLNSWSALENFPSYLESICQCDGVDWNLLEELCNLKYVKPKGRSFSANLVCQSLLLRYTSLQAYSMLLKLFPLPCVINLQKRVSGELDPMKVVRLLKTNGEISEDLIVMMDEMYLQKGVQYHGGRWYGSDEKGELYKGIIAIMIQGLKNSLPFVIKVIPEVTLRGDWLSDELSKAVSMLCHEGFNVRAVVTDNHSTNVSAFNKLISEFGTGSDLFIKHPSCNKKTYLFFDNVHLVKNIRNNLLATKMFAFPAIDIAIGANMITSPEGSIEWSDLHKVHELDRKMMDCNLRKAPKLDYKVLHPGNNKQNVNLALAIFHDTTIAACESYFPARPDLSGFLKLVHTWWTIVNSRTRFSPNSLGNAIIPNDGKVLFLDAFAKWLETWLSFNPTAFCLTKSTFNALIKTLKAQSLLITDLLSDGYEFVIMGKMQSDALERRFSQYRQMSGGRFLVSLREVRSSEKIIQYKALLKKNIKFMSEEVAMDTDSAFEDFKQEIDMVNTFELHEAGMTEESDDVSYYVAGYIGKKAAERLGCVDCKASLVSEATGECQYYELLDRGGLSAPSICLDVFVAQCFEILDAANHIISKHSQVPVREAALYLLKKSGLGCGVGCEVHAEKCKNLVCYKVINIYYNNYQKVVTSSEREDAVKLFKKRQLSKN